MKLTLLAILTIAILGSIVTGYVYHTDFAWDGREAWFAWHKSLGLIALLLTAIALPKLLSFKSDLGTGKLAQWTRYLRSALLFLILALPITGLLAVMAWHDNDGFLELVLGIAIPFPPRIPADIGASAEQYHKLAMQLFIVILFAIAVLRLFGMTTARKKSE